MKTISIWLIISLLIAIALPLVSCSQHVEILVLPPYETLSLDTAGEIILIPGEYTTIQKGIDAAVGGDAVSVAAGTYYENINFLGKNITVTSEARPDDTIIVAQRAMRSSVVVLLPPLLIKVAIVEYRYKKVR